MKTLFERYLLTAGTDDEHVPVKIARWEKKQVIVRTPGADEDVLSDFLHYNYKDIVDTEGNLQWDVTRIYSIFDEEDNETWLEVNMSRFRKHRFSDDPDAYVENGFNIIWFTGEKRKDIINWEEFIFSWSSGEVDRAYEEAEKMIRDNQYLTLPPDLIREIMQSLKTFFKEHMLM